MTQIAGYEVHPAAELFPLIEGQAFESLVGDVRTNGLQEPVRLWKGQVLDGRNRLRACEAAGVEPAFATVDATDPVAYVLSHNLHRRHLNESQRAMVGARAKGLFEEEARGRMLAGVRVEDPSLERGQGTGKSADQAATLVNTSRASVERASRVLSSGAPELVAAVDRGDVPVTAAARLVSMRHEDQRAVVAKVGRGEAKNVPQALRQIEDERRASVVGPGRPDHSVVVGDARALLKQLTERPACVIADPPYGIETHNTRRGGQDYADGEDYALSLLRDLCPMLAARCLPDAHLYFFSGYTYAYAFKQLLSEFFDVQDNPLIWVKDNHTMCDFSQGYPNKHEYVWFAKQRRSSRKLAKCVPDVLMFPRSRETTHSAEKPVDLLKALVEQSTVPGELVLDTFAGGGSAGVASVALGRRYVGFELEESWAGVARARAQEVAA